MSRERWLLFLNRQLGEPLEEKQLLSFPSQTSFRLFFFFFSVELHQSSLCMSYYILKFRNKSKSVVKFRNEICYFQSFRIP